MMILHHEACSYINCLLNKCTEIKPGKRTDCKAILRTGTKTVTAPIFLTIQFLENNKFEKISSPLPKSTSIRIGFVYEFSLHTIWLEFTVECQWCLRTSLYFVRSGLSLQEWNIKLISELKTEVDTDKLLCGQQHQHEIANGWSCTMLVTLG